MKVSEFSYGLPTGSIAQAPLEKRDHSRMFVMDRETGRGSHHHFYEFPLHLRAGDVVVVNDSEVIPARRTGKKDSGGLIELLLLSKSRNSGREETWDVLLSLSRHLCGFSAPTWPGAAASIHQKGQGRGVLRPDLLSDGLRAGSRVRGGSDSRLSLFPRCPR